MPQDNGTPVLRNEIIGINDSDISSRGKANPVIPGETGIAEISRRKQQAWRVVVSGEIFPCHIVRSVHHNNAFHREPPVNSVLP
jgi:hypothetical protein